MPMGHLDIPSTEVLFSQTTLMCIKLTKTNNVMCVVVIVGFTNNVFGTFAHFLKVSALVLFINRTISFSLDHSLSMWDSDTILAIA